MNPYLAVVLLLVPFLVVGVVMRLVHRWAEKNDPMSGSTGAGLWHTTGSQRRADYEDD